MDQSETLRKQRRQILREILKKPENEIILNEIKELLIKISQKELHYIPDKKFSANINKLAIALENLPEIPKKIESPIVNIHNPDKVKVNWKDYPEELKPKDKIQIDWKNQQKQDFKSPISWLHKQLETFLAPFLNRIIFWLSEPDKIEYSRNEIIEWYGKRKVIYDIRRDDVGKIKSCERREVI